MEQNTYSTRFLDLPRRLEVMGDCAFLNDRLENIFRNANQNEMRKILRWLTRAPIQNHDPGVLRVEDLKHDLSERMQPAVNDAPIDGRSIAELRILKTLPSIGGITDYESFFELLIYVQQAACKTPAGIRTATINTRPDRLGNCVRYPAPELIRPSLVRLYKYWQERVLPLPACVAVVMLAALANIHPFYDGNGRVARIFFNYVLNSLTPSRLEPIYLPIYEIAAFSNCGFLIRLRQAQYFGEWEPLFMFLVISAETLFSVKSPPLP